MSVLIDEKLEEIAAACQRYGIERLFVFGSALREDFRPGESDIDLLIEFGPLEITKRFHIYLDAREAFRNIFQADVDLVMKGAVKNKVDDDAVFGLIYSDLIVLTTAKLGWRKQR